MLILNALLGVGTALAPVLVAIFVGLGIWWGLPVLVAALTGGAAAVQPAAALQVEARKRDPKRGRPERPLPRSLLGLCRLRPALRHLRDDERQLGDPLHDAEDIGASATRGIAGADDLLGNGHRRPRPLCRDREDGFPSSRTYRFCPSWLRLAFLVSRRSCPTGDPSLGIVAFGLAGLGCSALLPLTISFGQEDLTTIAASVAGGLIAFYQIGLLASPPSASAPLEESTGSEP